MLRPSWRSCSTATTSALRNARFDKYDVRLELRCPQPLQGLEGRRVNAEPSKNRGHKSDVMGEAQHWYVRHSTRRSDGMWLAALILTLPPAASVLRNTIRMCDAFWSSSLCRDAYLGLHVHHAHLVLGLYRADGLYTCAVLVFLVFPVLYEPVGRRQHFKMSGEINRVCLH